METTEKRGRGRPRRTEPIFRLPVYGDAADMALARALAERWGCSVAEAFRRAVRQAAKRERLG
jgi:hypothetical protein